jgi:hypothetical protein
MRSVSDESGVGITVICNAFPRIICTPFCPSTPTRALSHGAVHSLEYQHADDEQRRAEHYKPSCILMLHLGFLLIVNLSLL